MIWFLDILINSSKYNLSGILQSQFDPYIPFDLLNIEDELFDITDLFRSFVRGGQIINKKVHNFHPLISEESIPYVIVIYFNRGKLGMYFDENSKNINIGGLKD